MIVIANEWDDGDDGAKKTIPRNWMPLHDEVAPVRMDAAAAAVDDLHTEEAWIREEQHSQSHCTHHRDEVVDVVVVHDDDVAHDDDGRCNDCRRIRWMEFQEDHHHWMMHHYFLLLHRDYVLDDVPHDGDDGDGVGVGHAAGVGIAVVADIHHDGDEHDEDDEDAAAVLQEGGAMHCHRMDADVDAAAAAAAVVVAADEMKDDGDYDEGGEDDGNDGIAAALVVVVVVRANSMMMKC